MKTVPIPRLSTCSLQACERPGVRDIGGCDECDRMLCVLHISPRFHKCIQEISDSEYEKRLEAEIKAIQARINLEALCRRVSNLSNGQACRIDLAPTIGTNMMMGHANYHARIEFDNGAPSWLLRVPRTGRRTSGLPSALVESLILSESGTLKFLETTSVPAPRAFDHGLTERGTDHGIGVDYIIIEELPGTPWKGEAPRKVLDGLADMLIEIEKHPFKQAGSLYWNPTAGLEIGPVTSDRFLALSPAGPYSTSAEYYSAFIEQHLELIADGQLYTQYPVDAYLVFRYLLDNVPKLVENDEDEDEDLGRFYLKHVDDKGDHLLVNQDGNITGIIDWQMARVVPRSEAFGPSLVSADMNSVCSGNTLLSLNDLILQDALESKGSFSLAQCMSNDRARRFFWGLALEPDWQAAFPLVHGLLKSFGEDSDWSQWRTTALKTYGKQDFPAGWQLMTGEGVDK